MSIWNTKYNVKVEMLERFFNRRSSGQIRKDVEESMESFVGTRSEYDAEFARRLKYDETVQKEAVKEHQKQVMLVISEWQEELRATYDMRPEVFDIVYGVAYEQGHSAGYNEVEGVFYDLADKFMTVYDLGFESGRG